MGKIALTNEAQILRELIRHQGEVLFSELAESLNKSDNHLSQLTSELESLGLLTKEPTRPMKISLTSRGKEAFREFLRRYHLAFSNGDRVNRKENRTLHPEVKKDPPSLERPQILAFLESLSQPLKESLHSILSDYIPMELIKQLHAELDSEIKDLLWEHMQRHFRIQDSDPKKVRK